MPIIWRVPINCASLIGNFPHPGGITGQEISSPDYYYEGRLRGSSAGRCVFQVTLSGHGVFRDKAGEHIVGPGTGFLVEVSDPETAYFYPEESRETWRIMYVLLHNASEITREMVSRFGHIYHLGTEHPVLTRMQEYKRFSGALLEMSPGESLTLASSIFAALMDAGIGKTGISASAHLVNKAVKFTFDNLNQNINVSDIASHLQVSREHLSRIFRQELGVGPLEYLTREKIRYACELLKTSNWSCKEICEELGYDNSSHFARTFRRFTGTTPNEFRKKGTILF